MPGVVTNAALNPEQAWLDFHPNQDVSIYRDSIAKGYTYGGGDNWTGGGTPQNAFEQKAANGGVAGASFHGGMPVLGGSGQGRTTSSLATGGNVASGGGGYKADAQLAQIRDDFRRMTESGISSLNEDLNDRGIFSSGVGGKLANDFRTQIGQQEGSAIERLMNDILGRNQSYELAKAQAEWQKQLAMMGQGSQRFSSGDTGGNSNDDLLSMFQMMMGGGGGSAPGYQTGPMGHNTGPLGSLFGIPGGGGLGGGMPSGADMEAAGGGWIGPDTKTGAGNLGNGTLDWLSGIF